MSRRGHRKRREDRGPVFVEVAGRLYLNLAFDLEPLGEDLRVRVSKEMSLTADEIVLLRKLTPAEEKLARRCRRDADTEAWARILG